MEALSCLAALAEAVRDKAPALMEDAREKVLRQLLAAAEEVYSQVQPLCEAKVEAKAQAELLIGRIYQYCAAAGGATSASHSDEEASLTTSYEAKAEKHLSRAVKLSPGNATAWAALAEVLFEYKQDAAAAETCAKEAARLQNSPENLRLLSFLARTPSADRTPEMASAAAVEAAKAAVAADPKDFQSWEKLGTANLWSFMNTNTKELELLSKATKAFSQATKVAASMPPITVDSVCAEAVARIPDDAALPAPLSPAAAACVESALSKGKAACETVGSSGGFSALFDLHRNFAALLSLSLDFEDSIREYRAAAAICGGCSSSSSGSGGSMPEVAEMVAHVRGTAQQIKDLPAALKGGDKVLSELAKLCAAPVPVTVVGARKASTFSSLSAGRNDGVYLQCRVLGPLKAMDKPPHQALVVDADKTVFVLGLHHLPGDYASELRDRSYPVRILDPVKKVVSTGETAGGAGDGYSFECVLPGSWEHLLINDRPHKVAKSRAGQLLGRLSVSAGQS